tara:strand:+ start:330 stop:803 length:474 start_codon:yes stop_codon:yes gene_type:complete
MPRLPVDGKKVIEYRLTLGSYERERLDSLITSLQVKNIGEPVVALMSDISGMAVLLYGLSSVIGFKFEAPEFIDDAGDLVNAFFDQLKEAANAVAPPGSPASRARGLLSLFGSPTNNVFLQELFQTLTGSQDTFDPDSVNYSGIAPDYIDPGLRGGM